MWNYLVLWSIIFGLAVGQVDDNSCVVNSLNGQIRGFSALSPTGTQICRFSGIPYAKPPTGDLRFKRPVPIENWETVINATASQFACTQVNPYEDVEISEDCLYLNLWIPASILNSTSRSAATMIWIHGGALITGSGSWMAGDNDVITASIQYRLGPLGFLYFGNEEAPGNMGLIDQNLAIKWIYDNIGVFGGNKDEITLFGESAGSFSVSHHLLSPLSQNFFKRAILMSGVATAPIIWKSQEDAIKFSYEVAEHAGCYSPSDDPQKSIDEIITCMKTKDKLLINYGEYKPKFLLDFAAAVTVDGYFLTDTPENLLQVAIKNNTKIDIIIGNVRDEGTLFLPDLYPTNFNVSGNATVNVTEFSTILNHAFGNRPEVERDAIITHYKHWENFNDDSQNARRVAHAAADFSFVCPAMDFAQKWGNDVQKVYYYWFTHVTESTPYPEWVGVIHASEVEYLMGVPLMVPTRPENEKSLSRKMQELFVNFAKSG